MKGAGDPYCVTSLTEVLLGSGYRKLILASDGEPALVSLQRAAGARAGVAGGIETIHDISAPHDSSGNGLAEMAVKEIKCKVRTIKHQVEQLHGIVISPTHHSLAWMPMYAAALVNRARVGMDGKTAWEVRKGKPCKRALAPLGGESAQLAERESEVFIRVWIPGRLFLRCGGWEGYDVDWQ